MITEFHPWAIRRYHDEAPEEQLKQLEEMDYRVSVILPTGELKSMDSRDDVMKYWGALGAETAHLDLFAQPA